MKNKIQTNRVRSFLSIMLVLLLSGCGEYFTDPLLDKETGNEINLLIVDFNFFTTTMTYHLLDAADGSPITSEAKISFSGQNGNDIVNFAGEKKGDFYTSQGQMELTIDPNVPISAGSPVEFAVHVEVPGYNSLAKGIQFQTEGRKTFELYLTKTDEEILTDVGGDVDFGNGDTSFVFMAPAETLKSASGDEKQYEISYSVSIKDLLKFKDEQGNFLFASSQEVLEVYYQDKENFVSLSTFKFTKYKPGIELINIDGKKRNVLFQKLETGGLVSLSFGGRPVDNLNGGKINSICKFKGDENPALFGFFGFENSAWNLLGTEVKYESLRFRYTLAKVVDDSVCETGAKFIFQSNSKTSFSIDADLYDMNDEFITSLSFKGNFPEEFTLENVPADPVKVIFRNNNPAFKAIPPMEINSLCNGDYEIEVIKKSDYVEYQIVLKALCADNPAIGFAPTYNVEFRLKNSDDAWQGVRIEGGVINLLCLPNQEYEMRLLWEGEWEYATYFTKFDSNGNYIGNTELNATVRSKKLEDGRMQINIEKIFSQSICNDLGW